MKYSLVLQFRVNDLTDYDKVIVIEDVLIKNLRGLAILDGHDSGGSEMNIFVFTNSPQETFERAKPIVKAGRMLATLSAAYRLSGEDDYSRLWPVGATEPFAVT